MQPKMCRVHSALNPVMKNPQVCMYRLVPNRFYALLCSLPDFPQLNVSSSATGSAFLALSRCPPMKSHTVCQGECLSSLAAPFGLEAKDLYNHPANADLKKKRSNPNVLAPGDIVSLPDSPTQKLANCDTGKSHKFVVNLPKVKLRVLLKSWKDEPYAEETIRSHR